MPMRLMRQAAIKPMSSTRSMLARLLRTPSSGAAETTRVWPLDRVRPARTHRVRVGSENHVVMSHQKSWGSKVGVRDEQHHYATQ